MLNTILSTVTTAWNKTIIIAEDTNTDYEKLSAVLENHKRSNQNIQQSQPVKMQKP